LNRQPKLVFQENLHVPEDLNKSSSNKINIISQVIVTPPQLPTKTPDEIAKVKQPSSINLEEK